MRSFSKIWFVAAAFVFSSCNTDPEQELMSVFFTAVQGGNDAGIQRVSLAPFEGKVVSWEIVESGPETEAPFELQALEEALRQKRSDVRSQRDRNANFADDNRDTYEAYKTKYAEDPSAPFTGELLAFHEEWQERLGTQKQLEADADQLAFDVRAMKDAAALSVSTSVTDKFDGNVTGKTLQLKINDGTEDKMYNFRLLRYDLADQERNIRPIARWIIAEIQEGA